MTLEAFVFASTVFSVDWPKKKILLNNKDKSKQRLNLYLTICIFFNYPSLVCTKYVFIDVGDVTLLVYMDMLIFNARTFKLWNKQLLEFPPFSIPQQNVINDGLPVRSTCMAQNIARKRRQHTWNWARSCWYLWVASEVRWFLLSSHIASPQDCEPLHHTFFDCND